ncbi:MAG: hypothetical protein BGO24_12515 [Sphingomonas sp. 67-36]|nr:MAG: hypothetical protein BGO24_12515 [Sphingomonas sp. 67-36]
MSIGWMSAAITSARANWSARMKGSRDSSGGSGNCASSQSMIARLCVKARPSTNRVGTSPCGFIARFAAEVCAPSSRLTGTIS